MKQALKQPDAAKIGGKKIKNRETNMMGDKKGRLHLGRQEFDEIYTPHQGFEAQGDRKRKFGEKKELERGRKGKKGEERKKKKGKKSVGLGGLGKGYDDMED